MSDAGEDQRAVMARSLAYLFAGGATLGFLSLALIPQGHDANVPANVAVLGLAFAVAVLAIAWFDRMPRRMFPALMGLGTLLIGGCVYFNGSASGDDEVFYLWVIVYAAYFLTRIEVAVHLALIAVTYAGALALLEPVAEWLYRWVIMVGTLGMAALLVGLLRMRMQGLVHRLAEAAQTDHLTNLANRRGLHETFESELERSRRSGTPLCLLIGDLDHFKEVNDRLGHQAGDKALERVALILAAVARRLDTVARIGGEEFAVLAPHTDAPGGVALAERLREAIRAAFAREEVPLTMSFGVAVAPVHGHAVEPLLQSADQALYAAKERGRNLTVLAGTGGTGTLKARPRPSVPRGRRAA